MAKPTYRLSRLAEADYAEILRFTGRRWGREQSVIYRRLLNDGIDAVAREPYRLNSHSRDELGPGLRSFHVAVVAGHPGLGRHVIYYRPMTNVVEVIRILHERMEASSKLP